MAASAAAAATGCLDNQESPDAGERGSDDEGGARDIPGIGDPPDGVYHPTHSDPMEMVGSSTAGDYEVTVMYTLPHRFWTVTGSRTERVDPTSEDDVHLMVVVSDAESGAVLPVDTGVSVELSKEEEPVYDRNPWTMISQRMGYHYGDNVPLDGDGEYELNVSLGRLSDVARADTLEERFLEDAEASFRLQLDEANIQEMAMDARYFPESKWGAAEALPPMGQEDEGMGVDDRNTSEGGADVDGGIGDDGDSIDGEMDDEGAGGRMMPYSHAPEPEDLPGELLGIEKQDDAVFAVSHVPGRSRFADGDYLLVSPRTPYNRCVLPAMALELASGEPLPSTLDVETGLHYGATVGDLGRRQQVEIQVVTPPQVSRHMGYETSFLEMDSVTVDVSGTD